MSELSDASLRCGASFWVNVATFGPDATPGNMTRVVELAEELDYEAAVVPDHLMLPASGDPGFGSMTESLMALSFFAAKTARIRLGTSVMAAPLRNPVLLAKQVAALDVLSGGRAILGVAAGWSEAEFANLGMSFTDRGARLDETICLLRHLFAGSGAPFMGTFNQLVNYRFEPLPPQGEGLPILIGGDSSAALRRAARLGDMWQSSVTTEEIFRSRSNEIRRHAAGRQVSVGTEMRIGVDGFGSAPPKSAQQTAENIEAWCRAGCQRFSIGFRPYEQADALLVWFAQEVAPLIGR